jgi:hypothetical protein
MKLTIDGVWRGDIMPPPVVGGVFFSILGAGQDLAAYSHAFGLGLGCSVALLALGGGLSLWLPSEKRTTAS